MKPLIYVIIIGVVAFLMINLIPAMYYGVAGTPRIVLLTPVCNSTISSPVTFSFKPEPHPYHHYLLQVRRDTWDSDNLIQQDLNETSISLDLEPGYYLFNVLGRDASNESRAGSGPCGFTVE